jgi:hypothetical protein
MTEKSDKDLILDFLEGMKKDIIATHIAKKQVASGRTILSFEAEATDDKGLLTGPKHTKALESGRGPGPGGPNFKNTIAQWIKDKGIARGRTESQINSLAFVMARKIVNEGTVLFRQGGKSGVISSNVTFERIKAFERTFADKYASKYASEIMEILKYKV